MRYDTADAVLSQVQPGYLRDLLSTILWEMVSNVDQSDERKHCFLDSDWLEFAASLQIHATYLSDF